MFMQTGNKVIEEKRQGEVMLSEGSGHSGKFFLESYGCAMNFSDSEIVASILNKVGYTSTKITEEADLILLNTCAIRENAETRVRNRLKEFKSLKKGKPKLLVGLLGCMAERLKSVLLEEEKMVDMVVGPDAYRDLPRIIQSANQGGREVNVMLSLEETYADISPVRLDAKGVSAFISITRGCDNMCSFCVVPFTRGRERSRDPESIVREAEQLFEAGYREVTLLGQNVDSYLWYEGKAKKELTEEEKKLAVNFAGLLKKVAAVSPDLRIRFSTSNPQDMTDDVLEAIAAHDNICKFVHLPVQSGSNRMLLSMNRGYTLEKYLERIDAIRRIIPDGGISTDIISGFCGETEEDHRATLDLMEKVKFDFAYMFAYSERPGTPAQKKFTDDVPEEVKQRRLAEIISLQQKHSSIRIEEMRHLTQLVLVEGVSKKSSLNLSGRNSRNAVVVFPSGGQRPGTYVKVKVTGTTKATLLGEAV